MQETNHNNGAKFLLHCLQVCSQIKQEKPSGDCKTEPMDTTMSSSASLSTNADEDKKPEVKKEPKEEEDGSAVSNSSPAAPQSKKKSEFCERGNFKKNVLTF